MSSKTRGIILQTTNYSETSLVVKIYTETSGLGSYIVSGVRSRNSKFGMPYAQTSENNDGNISLIEKGGLQDNVQNSGHELQPPVELWSINLDNHPDSETNRPYIF